MVEWKEHAKSIGRDVAISLIILCIILGSLYIYSGRWPPLVVIESPSMSHGQGDIPESQIGVIDPGDIVVVQQVGKDKITTYVEGKANGHRTYGQYGDVVIYRPGGSKRSTPIIHRPVIYLRYSDETNSFSAPALRKLEYGEDWETSQGEQWANLTGTIYLYNYGYADKTIRLELTPLLDSAHSGFITMGDHNSVYDQHPQTGISKEPVRGNWIEGRARGELPWFGILKLMSIGKTELVPSNSWNNLFITIGLIIVIPFIIEIAMNYIETEPDKDNPKNKRKNLPESTYDKKDFRSSSAKEAAKRFRSKAQPEAMEEHIAATETGSGSPADETEAEKTSQSDPTNIDEDSKLEFEDDFKELEEEMDEEKEEDRPVVEKRKRKVVKKRIKTVDDVEEKDKEEEGKDIFEDI